MCGFAGYSSQNNNVNQPVLKAMADSLKSRGPDSEGLWWNDKQTIGLAHRRLAVRDITSCGHQPMVSASGRFVIAYNGEIYNTIQLREISENTAFKGHSDTEVMLAVIEKLGVHKACEHFIGMFAFALWDKDENTLYLARDRLGIKPLYYGWQNNQWFFASQPKAMLAHKGFQAKLNESAKNAFLQYACVPEGMCIYQDLKKLTPGTIATLRLNGSEDNHSFWSLAKVVAGAKNEQKTDSWQRVSEKQWQDDLHDLLIDAVKIRMESDVPLGTFLSGGIDSSLVTAIMQSQSNDPIKSFSIGFEETGYNEAPYAKQIANHLGTDHHELYVTSHDALQVIPKLSTMYDEPFADVSQIPTYLVSHFTRQHVTVALSGDGGDELFAGYNRYFLGEKLWRMRKGIPGWLLRNLGPRVSKMPAFFWHFLEKLPKIPPQLQQKFIKAIELMNLNNPADVYYQLVKFWDCVPHEFIWNQELHSLTEQFQYWDTLNYLPADILAKVDRSSMAESLEVRVPLLDHRLLQMAWQLPMHMKMHNNGGKVILKNILQSYVPKKLFERPKMGFGVPVGDWLRGPLQDWAENLLSGYEDNLIPQVSKAALLNMWCDHKLGRGNHHYRLWVLCMLLNWQNSNKIANNAD